MSWLLLLFTNVSLVTYSRDIETILCSMVHAVLKCQKHTHCWMSMPVRYHYAIPSYQTNHSRTKIWANKIQICHREEISEDYLDNGRRLAVVQRIAIGSRAVPGLVVRRPQENRQVLPGERQLQVYMLHVFFFFFLF